MNFSKRALSIILTLCIILSAASIQIVSAVATKTEKVAAKSSTKSVSANSYGLVDNIQDGTILHCFDWKYNDIKAELKNIAEAGFTAVQTSPAQGNNNHGTWYWLYQPRGFYIGTNDLGSKDELASLCSEAEKYGIKVVVDVVANHLEGSHSNIVDDLKPAQYWHTFGGSIDWKNRWQVINGDIGMQDLATENSYVQQVVKKYIQELKSVGVDGIRFDAAKHIGLPSEGDQFWSVITSDKSLWYYGEILKAPDDRDTGNEGLMKEYTNYITVTDSNYGKTLRDAFAGGSVPSSYGNWAARGISNDKLLYWAESHDTWSNGTDWGYSWGISQNNIDRAYALAASRDDITALYFSRPSTHDKESIKGGQKGSTHFTSKEVAAVNHFHNAMVGQKDYYTTGGGCAAVCREQGAVITKGSGSGQVTVPNGGNTTKPGTYTDEITGSKWTVTSSTISGNIGSSGIAVIYNQKKNPTNTISQQGGKFKSDTLNLTLGLENATSGTYQIDNGEVKTYTDTVNITIGSGVPYGSTITVKLTATGEGGTSSAEYTFTKVDPSAMRVIDFSGNVVYFWNTSNFSAPACYTWPTGGDGAVEWPGSSMTYVDTFGGYKLYKYVVPSTDTNIIFSDNGNNQTENLTMPSDMVVYDGSKNTWVDANSIDDDVVAQRGGTSSSSATKPTGGDPDTKIYKYGDANLDDAVSIADVTLVQKAISRATTLNDIQKKAADINGSGVVDVTDATAIQKFCIKSISTFPVGTTFTYGDTPTSSSSTKSTSVPENITITLVDGSPQKWLSDAGAKFVLEDTSTGKRYDMSGGDGTWTVTIPKSVTNIKIHRTNPEDGSTWNSWTTTVGGTTYTAVENESGSWS